jgi:hypothetical protein
VQHQLPLAPRARTTDPDTSHAAAASVTSLANTQRGIYMLLSLDGPATDEELLYRWHERMAAPMSPSGLRTRRSELVDMGYVRDTGDRRPLQSGRNAIVWGIA